MTTNPFSPLSESSNEKTRIGCSTVWRVDPEGYFTPYPFMSIMEGTESTPNNDPYELEIFFDTDGAGTLNIIKTFPEEQFTCTSVKFRIPCVD